MKTISYQRWRAMVLALPLPLLLVFTTDSPAQTLRFTGPPHLSTNGNCLLNLLGPTGAVFQVQVSSNLFEWRSISTVTNTTGEVEVLDADAALAGCRFYRAASSTGTLVPLPEFVRIPAGTFVMGSPEIEVVGWIPAWGERVQHTVTLTHDFFMSKYEVTQARYLALAGDNPSFFTTPPDLDRPVEQVSWYDATNYCYALTQAERAAGHLPIGWAYRLPTEAEWEYACRAGTTTAFAYGDALRSGMANFDGQGEYQAGVGTTYNPDGISLGRTTAVGSYEPNAFGLYDMHGNVAEWCLDWMGDYPPEAVTDPEGPASGIARVVRGGSYQIQGGYCRSATRGAPPPDVSNESIGFRPVLAPIQ